MKNPSALRAGLTTRSRWLARCCASALALSVMPATAQQKPSVSFVETFDKLDTARWYISDGWVNGDHQNCMWSKDEIAVKDGVLSVGFSRNANKLRPYTCGEIQTQGVFGYGTYEVRLRTPAGSGLNANFFTFIGPVHKQPHDEIDFEFLLKDTGRVQLNSYVSAKGGNEYFAPLPNPSDAKYTDYAIIWEAGRLRWFIDAVQVHELTDPAKIPSHDSKIYISLWGTDTLTDWMGPFRDPGSPIAMEVDRVAFTAPGQACQFENSLVCGGH